MTLRGTFPTLSTTESYEIPGMGPGGEIGELQGQFVIRENLAQIGRVAPMRIAARLAVHSVPERRTGQHKTGPGACSSMPQLVAARTDFHGSDILIRDLSPAGFVAETGERYPKGSVVRVRIPGAGTLLARLIAVQKGVIEAAFVNPVCDSTFRMVVRNRELEPLVNAA